MAFKDFLDKTFQIERLIVDPGDPNKSGYEIIAATFKAMIQPVSADDRFISDGNLVKSFKLFTTIDADLQATDKIIYDGRKWTVNGLQRFDFGSEPHIEAIIEEPNK